MPERLTDDLMVAPKEEECDALRQLAEITAEPGALRIQSQSAELELPSSAREALRRVTAYLSAKYAVAIEPYDEELTTQEAANLLGISRPYFIRLLEDQSAIPYEMVGRYRRLHLRDVLAYRDGQVLKAEVAGRQELDKARAAVGERSHAPAEA